MKLLKILNDTDKVLRETSEEVTFPISDEDKILIEEIKEYLRNSQLEGMSEKYNIRPGMGLTFVQLGIKKRIAIIVIEQEPNKFEDYVLINPRIISSSTEMIYAEEGEGCLSVATDVPGFVTRHARITVEYQDLEGNVQRLRAREEVAMAIQHEIDHLNGILYYDHINKKNPFLQEPGARGI